MLRFGSKEQKCCDLAVKSRSVAFLQWSKGSAAATCGDEGCVVVGETKGLHVDRKMVLVWKGQPHSRNTRLLLQKGGGHGEQRLLQAETVMLGPSG